MLWLRGDEWETVGQMGANGKDVWSGAKRSDKIGKNKDNTQAVEGWLAGVRKQVGVDELAVSTLDACLVAGAGCSWACHRIGFAH